MYEYVPPPPPQLLSLLRHWSIINKLHYVSRLSHSLLLMLKVKTSYLDTVNGDITKEQTMDN